MGTGQIQAGTTHPSAGNPQHGGYRPGLYMSQRYNYNWGNAKMYLDINNTLVVNVEGADKMYLRPDGELINILQDSIERL